MATLSEPVRRFIVQRLACYETPSQVAAAVKEEYGIEISRQRVHEYHPEHGEPAKKWRDLFAATRAAFLSDVSRIPIAQKAYRLQELNRLYQKNASAARENPQVSKELLIEAERFMGESYTNRREVTGRGGAPIAATLAVRFVSPAGPGNAGGSDAGG
jgi:hypothetical protein